SVLFLLLFVTARVYCCGMSTHIDIAHQAINWFKDARNGTDYREIILKHQDAFIAGNPYPDSMYSSFCYSGKFHSIAEDTHWSPFLNATVNYIRKKYPKPWDQDTEKLVAFTLGFVSHQVADVTWHSLGINQGFLTTMGDLNFFGSFPAAHSIGDPGGDMVASFDGDTRQLPSGLKECMAKWSVHQTHSLVVVGSSPATCWIVLRCPEFKSLVKLVNSELVASWLLGLLIRLCSWSVLLWHKTIDMLEHGTDTCSIPKSPLFISCNKSEHGILLQRTQRQKLWNPGMIMLQQDIHKTLRLSDVNIKQSRRGSFFSLSESLQSKIQKLKNFKKTCLGSANNPPQITENVNNVDQEVTMTPVEYSSSVPYARTGWSLAYGNFSGLSLSLVIGAPGYGTPGNSQHGCVYLVTSNAESGLPSRNFNLDSDADMILNGTVENGRFGTAVAVADLNQDGLDDLAVSAPSTESLVITSPWDPANDFPFNRTFDWINIILHFEKPIEQQHIFQWRKGKCEVGMELNTCTRGEDDCSYSKNDKQSVGRVYFVSVTSTPFPQPMATITGSETFMKLGTSLAVGNPYHHGDDDNMLAVSAATQNIQGRILDFKLPVQFDQSGAVYMINLTTVLQLGKDVSLKDVNYTTVFEGDRSFARFGWSLEFTDINQDGIKDLLFSAPFRTRDITDEIIGAEEGGLYAFYGGNNFPSGNATRGCQGVDPCPGVKASFVVKSTEERSRLGTTFISIPLPTASAVDLVVSSPRSSKSPFHSGSVHVLHLTKQWKG
ncbi:unnamed protein product, partial [Porites evermanni]